MLKKAEMSIFAAILALAIVILLTPGIEFYQTNQKMSLIEDNINEAIKDTTLVASIVDYNSLKCFNGKRPEEDFSYMDERTDAIFEKLGYTQKGDNLWVKDDIKISDPKVVFYPTTFSFVLNYKVSIPFKVLNKEIKEITSNKVSEAMLVFKGTDFKN